ncbi:hypothetical protein OQA88_9127 [Cercophora sp. LCS_1]
MDPLSIALGVAPLCLAALKGSRRLKDKIKLVRDYDGEVTRFRAKLKTQISVFRDESQLLLQSAGIQRGIAARMVHDCSHEHWAAANLEQCIQDHLGDKYIEVKETSERIANQIGKIEDLLQRLETEDSSRSSLHVRAQRAGHALWLAMRTSTIEESMGSLNETISDFRRLRKTARAFQKPTGRITGRKTLPNAYSLVAKYSASFFTALSASWSCSGSTGKHVAHTARWFLQPEASDTCVNFRMALESNALTGSSTQRSLLMLKIRSEDTLWANATLSLSQRPDSSERPAKARKVRFADSPSQTSTTTSTTRNMEPERPKQNPKLRDLGGIADLCHHLFQQIKVPQALQHESSIGYLKLHDTLAHHLIAVKDRAGTAIQSLPSPPTILSSAIQPGKEMAINSQLRLALVLAQAVLRYHSTQWWRQSWGLSDLSYFNIDKDLAISLETLHIDTNLAEKTEAITLQAALANALTPPSDDDALLLCGIRNATLYCLGVALLQVGRWECTLNPTDVVQVRRAAARPSLLGPKYDQLIAKCLYCDFGFGADLHTRELQTAMYENVICELVSIVDVLEKAR